MTGQHGGPRMRHDYSSHLRIFAGSWLSRIYLLCVGVVGSVVTYSLVTWNQPDTNLAGGWIIFATAPGSLVVTLFLNVHGTAGIPLVVACLIFGALLNDAVINGIGKLFCFVAGRLRRHYLRKSAAI
jgi:hypothetical protein